MMLISARHTRRSPMVLGLFVLFAVASAATADDVKPDSAQVSITPGELAELIQLEKAPTILDVRSEKEFNAAHIPGAVNIPHDALSDRIAEIGADKSDLVVVHCKSGYRAGIAERTLAEAGYSNVRDLKGHMNAWESGDYPTE
jgi:phage shock protein E